jgi:predicted RNase H-like HicB family nuclease
MAYKIEIFYSAEDNGYIAVTPELPGCSAFGETPEEALKEIGIAQCLWLEASKLEGKEIPEPRYPPGPLAGDRTKRMMRTVKATKNDKQIVFA